MFEEEKVEKVVEDLPEVVRDETDDADDVEITNLEPASTSGGTLKTIAAIGAGIAIGVAIKKKFPKWKEKREAKRERREIEKLSERGYVILKPEEVENITAEPEKETKTEETEEPEKETKD